MKICDCFSAYLDLSDRKLFRRKVIEKCETYFMSRTFFPPEVLCGPYTINHVAQNCFAQHKFAHSRSSQSAPYTVNHVAQHAMLRNMIDRVWAPLYSFRLKSNGGNAQSHYVMRPFLTCFYSEPLGGCTREVWRSRDNPGAIATEFEEILCPHLQDQIWSCAFRPRRSGYYVPF
jgi:hypothetical protein